MLTGLAAVAAVFLLHSLYLSVVAEDAFISFRYAANLAGGHGLAWNPGTPPVEGYTNFLWVLLSSLAIAVGLEVTVFAQVAGLVAGLLILAYTYLFAVRLLRLSPSAALIPCGLLAISGPLATWASSGMETALFTLLVLAACYHFIGGMSRRGRVRYLSPLLLLAATLTRPEGLLFAVVLFAMTGVLNGADPKARRGSTVLPFLVYLIPLIAYVVWRASYFGDWLPNTYYAKVGGSPYRFIRGLVYAGAFFVYFVLPFAPIVLLYAVRRKHTSRRRGLEHAFHNDPALRVCVVLCLVYTLYIVYVGGDYMAMYRFFVPVLPFFYLAAGSLSARMLARDGSAPPHSPALPAALLFLAAVVTAAHSTPIDSRLFPKPPRQHGHYAGVKTERWHVARLSLIGHFFRSYRQSTDESLATDAIGAISFYSGLKVYGFHGLVDKHIARRQSAGATPGLGLPGHEKEGALYVLSKRPTYVMFSRLLTPLPLGYPNDLEGEVAAVLRREYVPVSVELEDKVNGETGYFTFYQRKDRR